MASMVKRSKEEQLDLISLVVNPLMERDPKVTDPVEEKAVLPLHYLLEILVLRPVNKVLQNSSLLVEILKLSESLWAMMAELRVSPMLNLSPLKAPKKLLSSMVTILMTES